MFITGQKPKMHTAHTVTNENDMGELKRHISWNKCKIMHNKTGTEKWRERYSCRTYKKITKNTQNQID